MFHFFTLALVYDFLLSYTFYERKGAKRARKWPFLDQISVFKGHTTPNKRHLGMCTKHKVYKFDIYPFRCDKFNKVYSNGLKIGEISTKYFYVRGYSTLILYYGRPNCDVTFLDPYFSLKTQIRYFPTRRGCLFLKIKISNSFAVYYVAEALNVSLTHYLALVSKQNSVQDHKVHTIHLFSIVTIFITQNAKWFGVARHLNVHKNWKMFCFVFVFFPLRWNYPFGRQKIKTSG